MTYLVSALAYIYGIQFFVVIYDHIVNKPNDDIGYDLIPFIQIINHFKE